MQYRPAPLLRHPTSRFGMVLAALALCMQLWAGQASAQHFADWLVQGLWRTDVCTSPAESNNSTNRTLQAVCAMQHCPSCNAAGHAPFPLGYASANIERSRHVVEMTAAAQLHGFSSKHLHPPAQAPPQA